MASVFKSFKERLREGESLRVFSLGRIVHPLYIEMFAQAGGYDGFWIDFEALIADAGRNVCCRTSGSSKSIRLFRAACLLSAIGQ